MNILFYGNGDARNHGCEAIGKSLVKILHYDNSTHYQMSYASLNPSAERQYGLDKLIHIENLVNPPLKSKIKYLGYWLRQHVKYSDINYYKLIYADFLKNISSDKIYASIGGDNYSYGKSDWLYYLNREINHRQGKTILLGCSIAEEIRDIELINDLSLYAAIITRESLTFDALENAGISENVYLVPDPAFQLNTVYKPLPNGWAEGNTVGINISPMVMGLDKGADMALRNYQRLIEYIINDTDMTVALIPHVVWGHNDDRKPLTQLYETFKATGKIIMITDQTAEELKGYIARCRFMVAARTHASIAAYSSKVPTLVVGYSVKAKGIAKDIFGDYKNYVIPVQALNSENDLTKSFTWLIANENSISAHLEKIIPIYKTKVWELNRILKNMGQTFNN